MHKKSEFCGNDGVRSYNRATQIVDAEMSDRERRLDNNEKENQARISISTMRSWERIARDWRYRQLVTSCLKKEWHIY